jgi:hypothetical protein
LSGPGLAVDGEDTKFRRAAAGDGAATPPPPPRPLKLCPPLLPLPEGATAGGDVLGGETTAPLPGCGNFSDLLEAFEGVRLSGSFAAGGETAAGFLARLAAAGGVRLAEGSLAENWERAGVVVAFLSEGGDEGDGGATGDSSTRGIYVRAGSSPTLAH